LVTGSTRGTTSILHALTLVEEVKRSCASRAGSRVEPRGVASVATGRADLTLQTRHSQKQRNKALTLAHAQTIHYMHGS